MNTPTQQLMPVWLRVTIVLTALATGGYFFFDWSRVFPQTSFLPAASPERRCETPIADRKLSKALVKRLAALPVRSKREQAESLLGAPYCQLPFIQLRPKSKAQRFLYQQDDRPPWIVVLYEDNEYAGFAFSSQPPAQGQ